MLACMCESVISGHFDSQVQPGRQFLVPGSMRRGFGNRRNASGRSHPPELPFGGISHRRAGSHQNRRRHHRASATGRSAAEQTRGSGHRITREMEPMLRRTIREDVVLSSFLDADPDTIRGDESQIEQVLLQRAGRHARRREIDHRDPGRHAGQSLLFPAHGRGPGGLPHVVGQRHGNRDGRGTPGPGVRTVFQKPD